MDRTEITQIGIIGAGEMGQALGRVLTHANTQVLYYDKDPSRTTTANLRDIITTCQVLLLCIPSWEVKETVRKIAHEAHPHEPKLVLALSKGVEPGFVTMNQVLAKYVPEHYAYGVLYGPMIAEEIERGRPAYGAISVSAGKWLQPLREIFTEAHIHLEAYGDMRGIALCAVLKNMYAIAFGVADGMRLGYNAKGRLAVLVLREMKQVLRHFKADPTIAESIAGLGDLLATGSTSESFNYRIGKTVAEGIASERIKSEGLVALHELGEEVSLTQFPIAYFLNRAIFHYEHPKKLEEILIDY